MHVLLQVFMLLFSFTSLRIILESCREVDCRFRLVLGLALWRSVFGLDWCLGSELPYPLLAILVLLLLFRPR